MSSRDRHRLAESGEEHSGERPPAQRLRDGGQQVLRHRLGPKDRAKKKDPIRVLYNLLRERFLPHVLRSLRDSGLIESDRSLRQ
jgi:hypothetical protein